MPRVPHQLPVERAGMECTLVPCSPSRTVGTVLAEIECGDRTGCVAVGQGHHSRASSAT